MSALSLSLSLSLSLFTFFTFHMARDDEFDWSLGGLPHMR